MMRTNKLISTATISKNDNIPSHLEDDGKS